MADEVIDSTQAAAQALAQEDVSENPKLPEAVDNSKMKSFTYRNAKGEIKKRNVYLIHEDALTLTGFDFNKLSEAEKKVVHKVFDSREVTPPPEPGTTSIDYGALGINKAIFNKAYRNFLKQNIK